jgi:fibro-slime domain-containing protein
MWFKDWVRIPARYNYIHNKEKTNCSVTIPVAPGTPQDSMYKNTKYYDKLGFVLAPKEGPNTYVYSRLGDYETGVKKTRFRGDPSEYFPLDWLPHDPPEQKHNFAFCTELHTSFQYQSGLKFEFTGDDDCWVYINKKLMVDLGGLHNANSAYLNLDTMSTLKFGQTYDFDLFQCERHQIHSSSRIVTNIKQPSNTGSPVTNWKRDYGNMD